MGSFANQLFSLLLGWLQGAFSALWNIFRTGPEQQGVLGWIGEHWIAAVIGLCAFGVIADLLVYLFRWQPLQVWRSYFRRIRRRKEITDGADEDAWDTNGEEAEEAFRRADAGEAAYIRSGAGAGGRNRSGNRTEAGTEPEIPLAPESIRDDRLTRQEDAEREQAILAERREEILREEEEAMRRRDAAEDALLRRRRRRRRTEMIAEGGERVQISMAPQDLINAEEAYRKPVYPRKWKADEDRRYQDEWTDDGT